MKKEVAADLVFDCIANRDEDDYLVIAEIMDRTALSRSQVDHAIRYIKEVLAGEKAQPLVHDYDYGYYFAETQATAKAYEIYRLRIMLTQTTNLITGTVEPTASKFRTAASKRMVRYITRVREDLEDLVSDLS